MLHGLISVYFRFYHEQSQFCVLVTDQNVTPLWLFVLFVEDFRSVRNWVLCIEEKIESNFFPSCLPSCCYLLTQSLCWHQLSGYRHFNFYDSKKKFFFVFLAQGHCLPYLIINCTVHLIMYMYYFISAYNPKGNYIRLKKFVTQMQLVSI